MRRAVIALISLMAVAPAAAIELPVPAEGDVVGEVSTVVTRTRDTLLDIARAHGLGYNEIAAANPAVDPWVPGEGTRIVVPTQFVLPPGSREGIVINVAQMRLFYFLPPEPGEHTLQALQDWGIDADEVHLLHHDGVIR